MNKYKGQLLLILSTVIWGTAYIFQKMGCDYLGAFTFNFFRFSVGALSLIPVLFLFRSLDKRKSPQPEAEGIKYRKKDLIIGSLLCGLTQFGAGALQQIGLAYTTAGKTGFITSMHIVIVPILLIFLKRKVPFTTWISVAVAVFGMYMLCITEGFSIKLGDGLVFGCAVVYAMQILFIDAYADKTDALKLAMYQFAVAGILSGICMVIWETVALGDILSCVIPILYTGILEVAAAYTLEIFGQKTTPPAVTAIILSLESVFAVLSGMLFLGEELSGRETIGCLLMLSAFLLAQIGDLRRGKE